MIVRLLIRLGGKTGLCSLTVGGKVLSLRRMQYSIVRTVSNYLLLVFATRHGSSWSFTTDTFIFCWQTCLKEEKVGCVLSWLRNTNLQQIPRAPPEDLTVFVHVFRYVQSRMVYITLVLYHICWDVPRNLGSLGRVVPLRFMAAFYKIGVQKNLVFKWFFFSRECAWIYPNIGWCLVSVKQ